jgi:hypothetical protein
MRMSTDKYITFQELPPLAKTRRFYVLGRDQKPFAIIKWYGGWRKYVLCLEADTFLDHNALGKITEFLSTLNQTHNETKRLHRDT